MPPRFATYSAPSHITNIEQNGLGKNQSDRTNEIIVARAPDEDLRRWATFSPRCLRPATYKYVRKVGRPRHEWAQQLLTIALDKLDPSMDIKNFVKDPQLGAREVSMHI